MDTLMDTPSVEDIKSLVGSADSLCISLYMPTRHGLDALDNPIRLRNLLRTAEQNLSQQGHAEAMIHALLRPAYLMLQDTAFWKSSDGGLALFVAPGVFRRYRLPISFQESLTIESHFFIRPLLSLLHGDGRFYVLALSQNAVRLLEGTGETVREIALEGAPGSLEEALGYDEPQADQGVQYNAGRPFPGNTEPKEDRKEKIARFFHLVDKALPTEIRQGPVPLVLAGVEYETAIFHRITACPQVLEETIEGNPERLSKESLRDRGWELLQTLFQEAARQAGAHYTEATGTGLASADIREILPAARCGRVASLLVKEGALLHGHFDSDTDRVEVRAEGIGVEDLVNRAAIETLLHGGSVYTDWATSLPFAGPVAAIFRY